MDRVRFIQYSNEPKVIGAQDGSQQRMLYMDNEYGHRMKMAVQEALNNVNTFLRYLPANATHLCQPLDQFINREIKRIWRKEMG